MKSRFLATVLGGSVLAGLLAGGAAQAEPVLSAHYEINLTDQGATNSVRSTFRVKPGDKERLELYPNVVELTVQPVSDREYDLKIVVTPKKQATTAASLNKAFRGTFGVPLELNSGEGLIKVDGAISVVVLEDKTAQLLD